MDGDACRCNTSVIHTIGAIVRVVISVPSTNFFKTKGVTRRLQV